MSPPSLNDDELAAGWTVAAKMRYSRLHRLHWYCRDRRLAALRKEAHELQWLIAQPPVRNATWEALELVTR